MTFFDTNVLVYYTINQDNHKFELAKQSIYEALEQDTFFISPMVLSEYVFVLSKYKLHKQHEDKIKFFAKYVQSTVNHSTVLEAYDVCVKIDFCKNINDVIHLKIAEHHCKKLITFDSDFKKLQKHASIEIEILK